MSKPLSPFIDLEDRATSSLSVRWTAEDDGPRIHHSDGDVPPALSPLDAFAAHSRKLARELEETRKAGERRMSRLPPQHITKSLSEHKENRPAIFRQLSGDEDTVPPLPTIARHETGLVPQWNTPTNRPTSSLAHLSGPFRTDFQTENKENETTVTKKDTSPRTRDYFGDIPRSQSPVAFEKTLAAQYVRKQYPSSEPTPQPPTPSNPDLTFTLAPPNAAFARKSYHESSEDEYTSSNAGSTFSRPRKQSSSSGVSLPQSPNSPYLQTFERSPSAASNSSTPGNRKSRSHMNFSRPMSSSSLTNLAQFSHLSPSRQGSSASQRSVSPAAPPSLPTPTNPSFDNQSILSDGNTVQPELPRGRKGERVSALFDGLDGPDGKRFSALFGGLNGPTFGWQEPVFPGTPPLESRSSFDMPTPSSDGITRLSDELANDKRNLENENPERSDESDKGHKFSFGLDKLKSPHAIPEARRPSSSGGVSSTKAAPPPVEARPSTSHTSKPFVAPPIPPTPPDNASTTDSRSDHTIRPTTARTQSDYQALTSDEHVTKAIALHEQGDLKKSSYHLRIAAKLNNPTGMLLYALACRHGWGLRPNPKEGVQWLKKAVELAQLEVAEDEVPGEGKPSTVSDKQTRRAQFALCIYELGQCHMNGWGTAVDKSSALRCFEIAGNWGDLDALTEAGYCYAEGIGCKKDLKKAAKWYREAEKRGANMVGNSWIHKDKYADEEDRPSRSRRKSVAKPTPKSTFKEPKTPPSFDELPKKRDKSRTRSIFSRNKN